MLSVFLFLAHLYTLLCFDINQRGKLYEPGDPAILFVEKTEGRESRDTFLLKLQYIPVED
jgi:hypothetical protein